MTSPYSRLTQMPDTTVAAFVRDAAHCGGKTVQNFEAQPPPQLPYYDVGREWAAIQQRPIAAHTIAQLRWVMCDEANTLFSRAELGYNYYVRRDATSLQNLRRILGQVTTVLHAQGAIEASAVESLQNRITEVEKEVLASSDIRDWGWDKIALTGALWAVGVAGSFVFLSAAFGVGVHKAPQVYQALEKKWRSWRDKNDNDPRPPSALGGSGPESVAEAGRLGSGAVQRTALASAAPTSWKGWDASAKGYAQDDWAGTLLTGLVVYVALEALPVLGGWEIPELFAPNLAPAF